MKGIVATVLLLVTATSAQINFLNLFTGKETSLPWPINTDIKIGNVTEIKQNRTSLDMEASKNAIKLIELLRRMFGVGIFAIPPLDPYYNNEQKRIILSPQQLANDSITVNSVNITGAKYFYLDDFKLQVDTGRIDYKVIIDELRIINNLETNFLVNEIPINRRLTLSIILKQLVLTGAFQAEEKLLEGSEKKSVFQLVAATSFFNTSEVRVAIKNPGFGLLAFLPYLNKITSMPSQLLLDIKNNVENFILEAVMIQINEILNKLTVEQVKAFLLPSSIDLQR